MHQIVLRNRLNIIGTDTKLGLLTIYGTVTHIPSPISYLHKSTNCIHPNKYPPWQKNEIDIGRN